MEVGSTRVCLQITALLMGEIFCKDLRHENLKSRESARRLRICKLKSGLTFLSTTPSYCCKFCPYHISPATKTGDKACRGDSNQGTFDAARFPIKTYFQDHHLSLLRHFFKQFFRMTLQLTAPSIISLFQILYASFSLLFSSSCSSYTHLLAGT